MKSILRPMATMCMLLFYFFAQGQNITGYEYWFDDNFASRVSANVTAGAVCNINTDIDILSLSPGHHMFYYRVKSSDGKWSVPVSAPFANGHNNIVGYEYWFDDDYSTMQYVELTPGWGGNYDSKINVSGLTIANHTVSICFIDNHKAKSVPISSTFYYDGSVTGIDEIANTSGVIVYPNPAQDRISLEGVQHYDQLNVIDIAGKTVISGKTSSNKEILNISQLTPGVYTIVLTNKQHTAKLKFVKVN